MSLRSWSIARQKRFGPQSISRPPWTAMPATGSGSSAPSSTLTKKAGSNSRPDRAVDVYDILTQAFDLDELTTRMHALFKKKENLEIQRIHAMVAFFENDSCLSRQLAGYFGEKLKVENCGHCSFCKSGQAVLEHTTTLKPLTDYDCVGVSGAFTQAALGMHSVH